MNVYLIGLNLVFLGVAVLVTLFPDQAIRLNKRTLALIGLDELLPAQSPPTIWERLVGVYAVIFLLSILADDLRWWLGF
jgi:hypothetical protein